MSRKHGIPAMAGLLVCVLFLASVCRAQQQQKLSKDDQFLIAGMLRQAHDEVKKNYYDPKLQGLDWDARYRQYSAQVGTAPNLGEGFRLVAAFLGGLKDSHTFFEPPIRGAWFDAGYHFELVGNDCIITRIRPGTDAESKLHIGDQILTLNGFGVDRGDFHDLFYFFNVLAPQASVQLNLRSPSGEERQVVVNSLVKPHKKIIDLTNESDYTDLLHRIDKTDLMTRPRTAENGDIIIWQLPQFDLDIGRIETTIGAARKHKTLVLDLRGNPGGSVDTLKWVVGSLFDHDVKICDRVGRKDNKPEIAKRHGTPFTGKLIVLVDSGSGSAAELLARVVQLEHRGTVMGDKSAGAVMESRYYSESQGANGEVMYGFSVTDANLIMSDGKSLEKTGVTPDEMLLPTAADLAAGRDPVLAHAAELAGVKLAPEAAGKLFPFEWPPLL
jgi:carboxyl-terminal processing protease